MGHAHHFLSRLDRLSLPHVELALSLYNDVPLLQYILAAARLPDGAERAAISLDDPERGPFLLVTREGRFVTALGEGMRVSDLPVVTRAQLDTMALKVDDLRARMRAAVTFADGGGVAKLYARLFAAADELSREDFVAISVLQPLYPLEVLKLYLGAAVDLDDTRKKVLPMLSRATRRLPRFREVARSYWQTCWALGHLAVIASLDGWAPFAPYRPLAEKYEAHSFSWGAVRQGVRGIALRGSWAVARLGAPMLPTYLRLYLTDANSHFTVVDNGMALGALALRHPELRDEARRALSEGPYADRETPHGAFVWARADRISEAVARAFDAPEQLAAIQRQVGAKMAVKRGARLPHGHRYRFERPEDVPEALAMTLAVNDVTDFIEGTDALPAMLATLPWLARAAPEQLYLPRDYVEATRAPWDPEQVATILREYKTHYAEAQKPEGPSRNGPCACGSGKKYKRCCGAEVDA